MKKRTKKKLEKRLYNFHYSDFKNKGKTLKQMIRECKKLIRDRRNQLCLTKYEDNVIEDFCFDVVFIPESWSRIPHIRRRTMRNLYAVNYLLDGGIIDEQENKEEIV